MRVLIQNNQKEYKVTVNIKASIKEIVRKALEIEGITAPLELSVVLTDNNGIRMLNKDYRKKDSPTDVLSFPMYERRELNKLIFSSKLTSSEFILLGDIVISMEKAEEQAKEYNHSIEREIGFLTVHGVLHLLGYDHLKKSDREIMRAREEDILDSLGLSRIQE